MSANSQSSFWHGKHVVVTGGAGMIGHQAVKYLADLGAGRVTVLDDLSRGRLRNLHDTGCEFTYADCTNIQNLSAVKSADVVINFAAAVTGMHYNRLHHAEMFRKNMLLQLVPLWAAVMWKVPNYLQSSTVCVYPREMSYPVPEEEGQKGKPEKTNAGYGWAKRMGERYAMWVKEVYLTKRVAITRFSNAFGPADYFDPGTSHVIPALIRRTLGENPVRVYGTGNQSREFLYSGDAALGALKVMEHCPDAVPVNIGNPDNRITIRKLAYLIQDIMEIDKPLYFDPSIEDGYPRRGSDITRLEEATGWRPNTMLRLGLTRTIDWYLQNKDIAEGRSQ